jgi:hypothetical protein
MAHSVSYSRAREVASITLKMPELEVDSLTSTSA